MSTNCLVSKLKGSTNNNNLPIYGKIKVSVNSTGSSAYLRFYGPIKLEIIGDGYFISADPGEGHWSDGTNKDTTDRADGKYRSFAGGWHNVYVSAGSYNMFIYNKYDMSQYMNFVSLVSYTYSNINDFDYCIKNFNTISIVSNINTVGDVAQLLRNVEENHSIEALFYDTSVTLDLTELLNADINCNLTKLWISGSPNVTNKDTTTISAIQAKWPSIDLRV